MTYRNGTYIAFHADNTPNPVMSDRKYYELIKAWTARTDDDFTMINSHDKASAVRDSSLRTTLTASLMERLRNSKNFILIIGNTTKFDTDWVPLEIEKAIDLYNLPIIAAYTNYLAITKPDELRHLWPKALEKRIDNQTAKVLHISFKKEPLKAAINQFDVNNMPSSGLNYYIRSAYVNWRILSS